jgi:hypothetical protein
VKLWNEKGGGIEVKSQPGKREDLLEVAKKRK